MILFNFVVVVVVIIIIIIIIMLALPECPFLYCDDRSRMLLFGQ